jgi:hypothetical protein
MRRSRWTARSFVFLLCVSAVPLMDAFAQKLWTQEAALLGCYELFDSNGQRVDSSGAVAAAPRVHLDSMLHGKKMDGGGSIFRVIPLDSTGARLSEYDRSGPPASWRLSRQTDSLYVLFFTDSDAAGFAFAVTRPVRDTLFGNTRDFAGKDDPPRTRAIIAVRTTCRPIEQGAG